MDRINRFYWITVKNKISDFSIYPHEGWLSLALASVRLHVIQSESRQSGQSRPKHLIFARIQVPRE